ncbi:hypothetical protein JDV02_003092 [Purpureocillium takamizusanense]|uniref:Uncharacterized protein n=1 Tax=Purpureocillium takamizusanense TaxID=2060973 RepID=A0A9Q8QC95_9HYPO|nr:uncharacterized protein JDV02_003092 [Purpureocillium takamizusanense]UNI16678.1 hypothetical protein JDV02_003092 [Purpureocillium takamizusanense]
MSLPNEQPQLRLVALAARVAASPRRWDPEVDVLEQLNDIATSAEFHLRIDPTDEPLTEESLAARLEHLENKTPKGSLKTLDMKNTGSPSDQGLIKRSLTNLKHYKDPGRKSVSSEFHFTKNSTENDVNVVGVWIAARMCHELCYAYPLRYPLHSIISSLGPYTTTRPFRKADTAAATSAFGAVSSFLKVSVTLRWVCGLIHVLEMLIAC